MADRLLFAPTGAPLKVRGKYRGTWPAPVYVSKFADGTTGRHSFYSPAGKPLDFDRARAGANWLWRGNWPEGNTPRSDLVGGHVEHDGEVFPDPHFSGEKRAAPKVDPLEKLIASLRKLPAAQFVEVLERASV